MSSGCEYRTRCGRSKQQEVVAGAEVMIPPEKPAGQEREGQEKIEKEREEQTQRKWPC